MKLDPVWRTEEARALWRRFELDLMRAFADCRKSEREERIVDALAHVRDAAAARHGNESEALRGAIEAFGPLPDPPSRFVLGAAAMARLVAVVLIGQVGAFLLLLLGLGVADLFEPNQAGFWVYPNGAWALSYEAQPGAREVMGAWFAPASFAVVATGGVLIGLAMKLLFAARAQRG